MTLQGSSMEPAIKDGQKVMISNYAKGTDPERGDIVVFKAEKLTYIKRIIGLANEKVIIKNGAIFIVDSSEPQVEKQLDEPYLAPGTVTEPDGEFIVPDGQYFVLGDKRGASRDSRKIGCIPRKSITGKVVKIL
jgi:signal peptidase I